MKKVLQFPRKVWGIFMGRVAKIDAIDFHIKAADEARRNGDEEAFAYHHGKANGAV